MISLDDIREYREHRQEVRRALSEDNNNFW
jgi:hypothetical protein